MTYKELMDAARPHLGEICKGCYVCNGRACGNRMPGPGAKGNGDVAVRNYEKWQEVRINMDCLVKSAPIDTTFQMFGKTYRYPFFAGPVGAVQLHYGTELTDLTYNDILVSACADCGIAAFTGDGTNAEVMKAACAAIKKCGSGIPTVKPWNEETIGQKMQLVHEAGASCAAMDVDASGLPFLKNLDPPAGAKSVEEMADIIREARLPFIIKGIMTVDGAAKALKTGAAGIVVSNHGGRVLDGVPATAEVLPRIARYVHERSDMVVLVDGGIRSGLDVFRALALGADACLIARPFVTAVYGGGEEGVRVLVDKLGGELRDTMEMCGAGKLSEITDGMIFA